MSRSNTLRGSSTIGTPRNDWWRSRKDGSEFYAPHKEAAEALVIRCLACGVGAPFDIVINTDSGESLGAVRKLRHKRTQELRLQSAV